MFKRSAQIIINIILVSVLIGTIIVQAADDGTNIETDSTTITVYFDTNGTGWDDCSEIYCYMTGEYGQLSEYYSRKSRCTNEGNGIWKYQFDDYTIDKKDMFTIFFYNSNWQNFTYPILFDSTCVGDTVYCDGSTTPIDAYRQQTTAYWENHDNSKYGSIMRILETGEIVGIVVSPFTTKYDMFVDFLKSSYSTAIVNSDKDEQTFINELGYKLGLSGIEVERAIIYSGKNIKWYREYYIEPTTPTEPTQPTESQPKILGDVDGDGEVSIIDATCIQRHLCQLPVYVKGIGEPIK